MNILYVQPMFCSYDFTYYSFTISEYNLTFYFGWVLLDVLLLLPTHFEVKSNFLSTESCLAVIYLGISGLILNLNLLPYL